MKERRRHKRIAIKTPVKWKSGRHIKERLADAFFLNTRNIAQAGLFLKTTLRPKRGSHIELELITRKRSKPIKLKGKVVWVAKKRSQLHLYPGIGIEFKETSRNERKKLNAFLHNKFNNLHDAFELKNMYIKLKDMASRLVELEERHSSARHFKRVLDNAISEIDDVAHILDREINEIKRM